MAKRSSGYFDGGRAKKIPGGSKQAVQRNATSSTGAVRFREMTTQGLLLALSTATGTRAAAIERELSHRGVNRPTSHSTQENKDDASKPLPGESAYQRSDPNEALHKHVPDLPGYKIDVLGRQRPDYLNPGRVSEVERVAASGERIKRDAAFRLRVLKKFGTACVICGYAIHVEAAHLTPKHQLSDDRTENGAPLCPNHHWELDNGVLTTEQVKRARDAAFSVR